MQILLHTSKTMHISKADIDVTLPYFGNEAQELRNYLISLTLEKLEKAMNISNSLAKNVAYDYSVWSTDVHKTSPAALAFIGDIYSGLQAQTWTDDDWDYAQRHLWILSGLYGMLRPKDGVMPYRLEMGYKLPDEPYRNLYNFWTNKLAARIDPNVSIVNLAAVEYSKAVFPYVTNATIYTPKFLTVDPKSNHAKFVVVHAKIARGFFASWLIRHKIKDPQYLSNFAELGYTYNQELSTAFEPTFICNEFGGKGLSVRLSKN